MGSCLSPGCCFSSLVYLVNSIDSLSTLACEVLTFHSLWFLILSFSLLSHDIIATLSLY